MSVRVKRWLVKLFYSLAFAVVPPAYDRGEGPLKEPQGLVLPQPTRNTTEQVRREEGGGGGGDEWRMWIKRVMGR